MSPLGGEKRIAAALAELPDVTTWAVGGHSLGGLTASSFVSSHPSSVQGLLFHGSYPRHDLSHASVRVLAIDAENDTIITKDRRNTWFERLLSSGHAHAEVIEGGNHAGFGYYGPQRFPRADGVRTIPLDDQIKRAAQLTAQWLMVLPAISHGDRPRLSHSLQSWQRARLKLLSLSAFKSAGA